MKLLELFAGSRSIGNIAEQLCNNGDVCHQPAPRGSKTGTQGLKDAYTKSMIPEELVKEILDSIRFTLKQQVLLKLIKEDINGYEK